MNHSQAFGFLPSYVADDLAADKIERVELHVVQCETCQDWIDTYQLLEETLGGSADQAATFHPESESLAQFAIGTIAKRSLNGKEIAGHLAACADCRQEVALCKKAISRSRSFSSLRRWLPSGLHAGLHPSPQFALASTLILALVALVPILIISTRDIPRDDLRISGRSMVGNELIEAPNSVLAERSNVGSGGEVTFRAGDTVVFGDGFSISSEANVVVEIAGHEPD